MSTSKTLCVIGLGKLGAPVAACYAAKGHHVIGVDSNLQTLETLRRKEAPVFEPGLSEMLEAAADRLVLSDDVTESTKQADFIFILVPTPSEEDGSFSLRFMLDACEKIALGLREHPRRPIVVVSSTVMPGAIQSQVLPLLERVSGREAGVDFGLCYNPEFVALGSVLRDMLAPDFVLIGESDPQSGEQLAELLVPICNNHPPVARMNIVNAEVAKIAVNTFVTTKISFANLLARLCEQLPGGDVDQVSAALGLDSRIGPKYLRGAIGYGGPCFPRDNLALSRLAHQLDVAPLLPEATDAANRKEAHTLADLICHYLPDRGTVGILGLAYKENTPVVDESQGVLVAEELSRRGVSVVVYDPEAMPNARKVLPQTVRFTASAVECLEDSDVCAVVTPWSEFADLALQELSPRPQGRVVIDCWRLFKAPSAETNANLQVVSLGRELRR